MALESSVRFTVFGDITYDYIIVGASVKPFYRTVYDICVIAEICDSFFLSVSPFHQGINVSFIVYYGFITYRSAFQTIDMYLSGCSHIDGFILVIACDVKNARRSGYIRHFYIEMRLFRYRFRFRIWIRIYRVSFLVASEGDRRTDAKARECLDSFF